jgi:AcrR family transcriptional regulator
MRELKTLEKSREADDAADVRRGGRPPAGTDPAKRRQIMEGAAKVFSTLGFDVASMNDVAREAQVSKATLYVYFQDKEHLFSAVCGERRDRSIGELIAMLDPDRPLAKTLHDVGWQIAHRISQPDIVAANRIVIGVAERMPEIGNEFFSEGPLRLANALAAFLDAHKARGQIATDDSFLAAVQFLELAQAYIFRPRLYAMSKEAASEEEIEKVVASAVRVFLAAYGT